MKQFLAALLASALTLPLIGCASPVAAGGPLEDNPLSGGLGKTPALTGYTLAAPAYPEFPARPLEPDNGDWEAYDKAYQAYRQALDTLRDGGISPEVQAGLTAFAGRSTPLALAGHQGENAIYSPLSLWSALAMLAQCAGGSSRQQILDALGCAGTDTLQAQVSQVWKGLYTEDGISSLMLANSIWLNSALEGTYVPATLDTLSKDYYAGTYAVPMGTTEADQAVTEWVKEQTHGLIGGDSPVIQTSGETLALLASSLYYRAGWRDEFLSSLTKQDTFTDAAGQESHVDFMHRSEQGSFLREEGWQAARLGTQLGEMVFVLPDQGVSPESLLQDPDFLSRLEISGEGSR